MTLEHLGPATRTVEAATATRDEYVELLTRLAAAGLTPAGDVTVRLSALGRRFDERLAYDNARAVCAAAAAAGTSVTLGMEDHTTTDATLDVLLKLREEYPATGATLQAYLRRTESDCRDLAGAGSRVRLCKGGYREPESVAYRSARDIGKSYVRCAKVLLAGDGYPMFATADPRMIAIIEDRARWFDRRAGPVRVPAPLRRPDPGAGAPGRRGLHRADPDPVRPGLVRPPDAPARRTPGGPRPGPAGRLTGGRDAGQWSARRGGKPPVACGPQRSMVIRIRDLFCRSMAWRYSSQSGCSPAMQR